ncbi:helix-turn-helix domain-containing protein [Amycolatopsis aidingensis]|uniref:helix-turn-helix domain-containing protein n=1 Tax=Amycolatopsis aidingensis TaxID=2842453 RepID=UPI001C0DD90E|nr:helix-turn-helix domain-containing protein [Amycolatopsis aidingensis]
MAEQTNRSLASKLNYLFEMVRRPDGKEYTNEQVAEAVRATKTVKTISHSYIWQLRNGVRDNPTAQHLRGLAHFFEVPVSYFFDDEHSERIDAKLAEIKAEQERLTEMAGSSDAQLLAMRAGELSPEGRRQVMDLVDVVYRLEQVERKGGSNQSRDGGSARRREG